MLTIVMTIGSRAAAGAGGCRRNAQRRLGKRAGSVGRWRRPADTWHVRTEKRGQMGLEGVLTRGAARGAGAHRRPHGGDRDFGARFRARSPPVRALRLAAPPSRAARPSLRRSDGRSRLILRRITSAPAARAEQSSRGPRGRAPGSRRGREPAAGSPPASPAARCHALLPLVAPLRCASFQGC